MKLLKAMEIEIKRRSPSRNVRGVVVEGSTSTLKIRGNLQPEGNLRLVREVFGSKIEGAIKIYTEEKLFTYENGGDSDYVIYDGREWEVAMTKRYDTIIPHYKYTAILRKDER